MNIMDSIMGQVANAVRNHASPDTPGNSFDPEPLIGALGGILGGGGLGSLLGGGGNQQSQGGMNNAISSDNDPYGDPGLQGGGQQSAYGNAKSSDEDPYGDPGLR